MPSRSAAQESGLFGTRVGAARAGDYAPPGWEPTDDYPDVHEENEGRAEQADHRLIELSELSEKIYGRRLEAVF